MRYVAGGLSVLVAVVLLFTGLIHAAQPYYFIHTIASYRLLPASASGLMGLWLPYLQIAMAVCLGLGIAERAALYTAAAVFAAFTAAQVTVLARGIEIDCGCFGFVARSVSPASAALPTVLFGACVVAILGRRQPRAQAAGGTMEKRNATST